MLPDYEYKYQPRVPVIASTLNYPQCKDCGGWHHPSHLSRCIYNLNRRLKLERLVRKQLHYALTFATDAINHDAQLDTKIFELCDEAMEASRHLDED